MALPIIASNHQKLSFTQEEIRNITTALDPKTGGGVEVGSTNEERFVNKGNHIFLAFAYYRNIKNDIRNYPNNNSEVSRLMQDYPKSLMSDTLLKKTMADFSAIPEQRSWIEWFEKNSNVTIELMFDYLSSLDEDALKKVLSKSLGITSRIKRGHTERIVMLYKSTPLYNGVDHQKHFPKPAIQLFGS